MEKIIDEVKGLVVVGSEKDVVDAIVELEDKFQLSHGSHNQHSSSSSY